MTLLCLTVFFAASGGGGSVPPPPPHPAAAVTSVAVTCTVTALRTSGTTECTANVQGTGAFNTAVEWSVGGGGEIGAVAITVSRPRTLLDLADDESGYQVHLLYVVASDAEDRELDTNGAVERSVEAWNGWLAEQTSGRRLDPRLPGSGADPQGIQ